MRAGLESRIERMETAAIVGGSGFIGSRLAKALRHAGHKVVVIDVRDVSGSEYAYRYADVCDFGSIRRALEGADVVYNLAAEHRDDVRPISRYEKVNVTGANNICRACRVLRIERIVFTSTVAVYGSSAPDASESSKTAPTNAYGRSKLLAEQVYRDWHAESPSSRSLITVRPTVVFGEGNRGNVYELIRRIASGRFVMVGSGANRKSMAYVGNLAAFLTYVLELNRGVHMFNYADKPDYSMRQLVETIAHAVDRRIAGIRIPFVAAYTGGLLCDLVSAIIGQQLPISAIRVKKFLSTSTYAIRRADATGFRAPFRLNDALLRTIAHEANRSLPD